MQKIINVLSGNKEDIAPIWMMRQAGRHLPEYLEVRNTTNSFIDFCFSPEKAEKVTLQPIHRYDMDAAILFSDILVIPQAMNIEVLMKPDFGPFIPNPVRNANDLKEVIVPDVNESLDYVFDAIKMTKEILNNDIPLIGFAGSPWTILCYVVQGQGSKTFDKAQEFCFKTTILAQEKLRKIRVIT